MFLLSGFYFNTSLCRNPESLLSNCLRDGSPSMITLPCLETESPHYMGTWTIRIRVATANSLKVW